MNRRAVRDLRVFFAGEITFIGQLKEFFRYFCEEFSGAAGEEGGCCGKDDRLLNLGSGKGVGGKG
jgi:hypothetical protein